MEPTHVHRFGWCAFLLTLTVVFTFTIVNDVYLAEDFETDMMDGTECNINNVYITCCPNATNTDCEWNSIETGMWGTRTNETWTCYQVVATVNFTLCGRSYNSTVVLEQFVTYHDALQWYDFYLKNVTTIPCWYHAVDPTGTVTLIQPYRWVHIHNVFALRQPLFIVSFAPLLCFVCFLGPAFVCLVTNNKRLQHLEQTIHMYQRLQ